MNTAETVILSKLEDLMNDISNHNKLANNTDLEDIYNTLYICKRLLIASSEADNDCIYCNDFIDYQYECFKLINQGYYCAYDGQAESIYRHSTGKQVRVKII